MFTFTGVCYCRLTWQPSNNHSAFPCIIKTFDPAHEALCHVSFYPPIYVVCQVRKLRLYHYFEVLSLHNLF